MIGLSIMTRGRTGLKSVRTFIVGRWVFMDGFGAFDEVISLKEMT